MRTCLRLCCAVVLIACSSAASAGLFRAYLSPAGNDANDCTRGAPCRLLPRALSVVADGGEVWMLDSANYNTAQVNINKSVSILAVPGALGSVVATGCNSALNIDAPGIKVTLRNLVVVVLDCGSTGISFLQGLELDMEDCEISGMSDAGIEVAIESRVSVKNSVIRDSGAGLKTSNATAVLERVQLKGNGAGVLAHGGSRVTVTNSVVADSNVGIYASADTNAAIVTMFVTHSTLHGNGRAFLVQAVGGANASIVSDGNAIAFTFGTPFDFQDLGGIEVIFTSGANRVGYFAAGSAVKPGHSLTMLGSM